jgi:glycogen debranching enzyme
MTTPYLEKRERLADPVATTGDQLYLICSQNGLFPTPWSTSHIPHELWGVWAHPIKLLDGFWFAIRNQTTGVMTWLLEADACRAYGSHTEFDYRVDTLRVTRRDFVPDGVTGLAVTITVQFPPGFADRLELIALVRSDLRPAWLGEQVGMHDAPDRVTVADNQRHLRFSDANNPWVVLVGGSTAIQEVLLGDDAGSIQPTVGTGASARLTFRFHTRTADTSVVTFYVAGAVAGESEAFDAYAQLRTEGGSLWQQKEDRYAELARHARLQSPDAHLDATFYWSKVTGQMLARKTPDYGPRVSPSVGAGLPNYPWWFGIDTEYAILPMVQGGLFDLSKATLRLLKTVSEAHNPTEPGRVIHELLTTGIVYNPGNLVETPAFTRAVYQTWCWTGDHDFLEEMYPFCKQGILDYTLGKCDPDGDLCGAGRSIIETLEMHADFECIDVASYTWEALNFLADMARAVGDTVTVEVATSKAAALADRIRNEWWLADAALFADVRATVQEVDAALQRIDDLESTPDWQWVAGQAAQAHRLFDEQLATRRSADPAVDLPWLLRHWVVFCPMEVGVATAEQATQSFARLLSPEFCNEWGMYLHPERQEVMSINTGLLALALTRYGRIDDALKLVQPMAAALNRRTPGAISEALPDQWCFLQLWSNLGIISPLVEGVLGIEPQAGEQRLQVIPHFPTGWDKVALERFQVGNACFTVDASRTDSEYRLTVTQNKGQERYHLRVGFYIPPTTTVVAVQLNGSDTPWQWESTLAGRRLCCETTGQAELVVTIR